MNRKHVLKKFCLASVSLLLSLVACELALRLFNYDVFGSLENGRELVLRPADDPDLKYELSPGAAAHAWGADVEINVNGYRGKPGVIGKFDGNRIIVLGDSITFGNFLPVESTYPYQLTELLKEFSSDHDVLNFGIGGYDVLQEVALLEQRCPDYLPDLVIVGYCLNDVGIASPNLEYIERVRQYHTNPLSRFRVFQFAASRLERFAMGSFTRRKNDLEVFKQDFRSRITPIGQDELELRRLMQSVPAQHPSCWYRSEERIGRLRYAFQRLAMLADKYEFSAIVTIIPWLVGTADSYPHATAHRIVALEARRAGLGTMDCTRAFFREDITALRIRDGDLCHPNAQGHRIIAESLSTRIREM